jgi:hypothetical protein
LTVTSIGRRGWSQAKSSLTSKFDGRVTLPLADVLERVVQLQAQMDELTRLLTTQLEVNNQTTELFGRILATSSSRLDAIEDELRHGAPQTAATKKPPTSTPTPSARRKTTAGTSGEEP